MRLIDANKIKPTYHETNHYIGGGMYESYYGITESDIENAPTVEAIPIEWLEKYIVWLRDTNKGNWRGKYEEDLAKGLELVIKIWRQENKGVSE